MSSLTALAMALGLAALHYMPHTQTPKTGLESAEAFAADPGLKLRETFALRQMIGALAIQARLLSPGHHGVHCCIPAFQSLRCLPLGAVRGGSSLCRCYRVTWEQPQEADPAGDELS